jgi:hypothetical protein
MKTAVKQFFAIALAVALVIPSAIFVQGTAKASADADEWSVSLPNMQRRIRVGHTNSNKKWILYRDGKPVDFDKDEADGYADVDDIDEIDYEVDSSNSNAISVENVDWNYYKLKALKQGSARITITFTIKYTDGTEDKFSSKPYRVASCLTTESSARKNMSNVLKYYRKGKLKKANRYNRRLPKYADEVTVDEHVRRVFVKKAKRAKNLCEAYIVNMDNDKTPELIVWQGTCEADYVFRIYKYRNGKTHYVGKTSAFSSVICGYGSKPGFIRVMGHMGYEQVYYCRIENGKVRTKQIKYKGKKYRTAANYFPMRNQLRSIVKTAY